jgi:hypothetical protein
MPQRRALMALQVVASELYGSGTIPADTRPLN